MPRAAKSLGRPNHKNNERRPVREKASGHSEMKSDENNHSGSGTSKTDHSQPELQQSSRQDSTGQSGPFQDGLMAEHLKPRNMKQDSLLAPVETSSTPAPKTKTVKVKARRRS